MAIVVVRVSNLGEGEEISQSIISQKYGTHRGKDKKLEEQV